jgi:hypothetical protein
MAIQDEMYKMIESEINRIIEEGKELRSVNVDKVREVAKMLASLSTDKSDAENLVNQYIANIKLICE